MKQKSISSRTKARSWPLRALIMLLAARYLSSETTLVSYYPSPLGLYKSLRSAQDASFATSSGEVVIGDPSSNPNSSLTVYGTLKTAKLNVDPAQDSWESSGVGSIPRTVQCPAGKYVRGIELLECGSHPGTVCQVKLLCSHL
jgi:hypothetical protein